MALGIVFALLALGALNHAAYLALSSRFGPVAAGVSVGICDLLLSAALFGAGLADGKLSEEERLAAEITQMATEGLSDDFDLAREEVREFMTHTRRIGEVAHTIASFFGGPLARAVQNFLQSSGDSRDARH
jgi:hypothetical protein